MFKLLNVFAIIMLAFATSCGSDAQDKLDEEPRVDFSAFAPEYAGRWFFEVTEPSGSLVHRADLPDITTTVTLDPFGDVILDNLGECGVRIDLDQYELPSQGCVLTQEDGTRENIVIEGSWTLSGPNLRVELTGTSTISGGDVTRPISHELRAAFDGVALQPAPNPTPRTVYCSEVDGVFDGDRWIVNMHWNNCDDGNFYSAECIEEGNTDDADRYWSCDCFGPFESTEFRAGPNPAILDAGYVSDRCGWDLAEL